MNQQERDDLERLTREAASELAARARIEWKETRYAHVIVVALPVSDLQFDNWQRDGAMQTIAMAVTQAAALELSRRILFPLEGWSADNVPPPERLT